MMGKDDRVDSPRVADSRRLFWRSASWSASRSCPQNPENEEQFLGDPTGSNGETYKYPIAPLTPRSQQNCKGRSCLPPLQPLSIARRSLDEWPKAGSDDIGEWPQPPTPSGNRYNERLKLDLSTIQQNPDRGCEYGRTDKISLFDKECSKVAEHVSFGGSSVARDMDLLKQNGITHVLNCAGSVCSEYFKSDFVYRTLWLQDNSSEDILSIIYDVFDYFEDVKEQNGRVYVHCSQGVSRSTSLVIAYLMWRERQSFNDAFQFVKAVRGIADPNMGFACQLLQCQKRVQAAPFSPDSSLRMYRISPHSPYDPLHLVPKMLNDPSPSALDSRGAFIIHVRHAIYLWIGNKCETSMEKDAKGAVSQIVRYERVQRPVLVVKDGDEPYCFWSIFTNLIPVMEAKAKISAGERKVDAYNIDFEIFQKAITGGFIPPSALSNKEYEIHLPVKENSWSVLRQKFAANLMKEFVSAPKVSLSRMYSDSMMLVRSLSPSSTLSLSSSSPPFHSPDSISSDSNSSLQYLPESPLDSPSAGLYSIPLSSTLSGLSNLSIQPTNVSLTNSPEEDAVCMSSLPHPQVSDCKKVTTSLAERRGGMSKSLKLPGTTETTKVTKTQSSITYGQADGIRIQNSTSTVCQPDSIDAVFDSKDCTKCRDNVLTQNCDLKISPTQNCDLKISPRTVVNTYSCQKEAASVSGCSEEGGNHMHGDESDGSQYLFNTYSCQKEAASVSGCSEEGGNHMHGDESEESDIDSVSRSCNRKDHLALRWPSLEKLTEFGASHLDSRSAVAIFSPCIGLEHTETEILYFWVGKAFHLDETQGSLDSSTESENPDEMNWERAGYNVLTQLGLPENTPIKVVKEDGEPKEFIALLKTLQECCG